ncbi:hypothetical protein Q6D67_12135 [Haliea sp. E1-2-M8]|uniref:hypothetical protein n=1 Tax=Haliea sp. E1-2-M8 TaxID=3064706 RepID=UPI002726F3B0|nr:hypothetical protein [Haliea sp. E1-2-M8]MDO8862450.1 hypothetical protein [Haliea sp. E1-2-M8]
MTPSYPDPNRGDGGSTPDDPKSGTAQEKIEADARDAKREAGAKAREQAETGQHKLAEGADALSDAIDAAASNLDDHDREGLARYARELSSNLANAAGQLEDRSVDDLAKDAKRLARDNPALFMLGSIAVGFGLSRFFKASAERDHHDDSNAPRNAGTSRNEDFSTRTPVQPRMTETYRTPTAPGSGDGREIL